MSDRHRFYKERRVEISYSISVHDDDIEAAIRGHYGFAEMERLAADNQMPLDWWVGQVWTRTVRRFEDQEEMLRWLVDNTHMLGQQDRYRDWMIACVQSSMDRVMSVLQDSLLVGA